MSSVEQTNIHLKQRSLISILLPLSVLCMIAYPMQFFHGILNANARFAMLTLLCIFIIQKNKLFRYLDMQLTLSIFMYAGWCIFTSVWSDVPVLSLTKSILLLINMLVLILASIEWIRTRPWDRALDYLLILAFVSLISGFLGKYIANSDTAFVLSQNVLMFQGLSYGSNMYGTLLMMSLPFLLWKTYRSWVHKKIFIVWLFITINCLNFIIMTVSRASMLSAILILFGFISGFHLSKKFSVLLMGMMIILGLIAINPMLISDWIDSGNKFLHKSSSHNIFYSRELNWKYSSEGAMEGGLTGIGYAISKGMNDFDFNKTGNGISTYLYGREKGNSQLAIIEETGIIGFIFYLYFLTVISTKLLSLYFTVRSKDKRVLIGIVSGIFLGMVVHSVFEAWWDAPGSPEACYFWLLVGTIRGLEIIMKEESSRDVISRIET